MGRSVLAQEIGKRQPFDFPAEEALLNLMRSCSVLSAPSELLFKQHGISPPKYNILRILRRCVAREFLRANPMQASQGSAPREVILSSFLVQTA